jgi:predicted Zn-dependent protease
MRRAFAASPLLFGCALFFGCATASPLAPFGARPPQLEEDERLLWREAAEQEQRFEKAGVLYQDSALDEYVAQVAGRLAQAGELGGLAFRVHVLRSPFLNAFALPDGHLYVNLGMLARMDGEAQLATLLGHEMTHASHRHAVRRRRERKSDTDFGAALNAILPGIGSLAALSAVRGYSREMESEADEGGFELVARCGYDLEQAPQLFRKLQEELRDAGGSEPFFFGTHPALEARIESYRRLLLARGGGPGRDDKATFAERTRELVLESARLDLQFGRFASAKRSADRYLATGAAPARALFLLGEAARQQQKPALVDEALAQYARAIEADPRYPDPHRARGLLLMKRGERAAARSAFEHYLDLAPAALDRAWVLGYVKELQ